MQVERGYVWEMRWGWSSKLGRWGERWYELEGVLGLRGPIPGYLGKLMAGLLGIPSSGSAVSFFVADHVSRHRRVKGDPPPRKSGFRRHEGGFT